MSSGQISGTKCCQLRNLTESLFEQYLGQNLCLKYPPLAFTQAKSQHCHFWIVAIMIPVFILGRYSLFQFFKWAMHVLCALSLSIPQTVWSTGFKYWKFSGHKCFSHSVNTIFKWCQNYVSVFKHNIMHTVINICSVGRQFTWDNLLQKSWNYSGSCRSYFIQTFYIILLDLII